MPRSKHPFQLCSNATTFRLVPEEDKDIEIIQNDHSISISHGLELNDLVTELSELVVFPILYHKHLRKINISTPSGRTNST